MQTLKVKFKGIENLPKDEQDMVDYGLVANQVVGRPKGRFVRNYGDFSVYEVYKRKEFLMELGRIEVLFEGIEIEVTE